MSPLGQSRRFERASTSASPPTPDMSTRRAEVITTPASLPIKRSRGRLHHHYVRLLFFRHTHRQIMLPAVAV
jgi:hypothetical protein